MRNDHHLSVDDLAALAEGGSDRRILRELAAAQHSKQILLLWGVERLSRKGEHPDSPLVFRSLDFLRSAWRTHPDETRQVIADPAVSAWAMAAIRALRAGAETAFPGQMAALAAAVAVRSGLPCEMDVPTYGGRVVLPTLGRTETPYPDHTAKVVSAYGRVFVHVGAEQVRIPDDPASDALGWTGMRGLAVGDAPRRVSFRVDDLHPSRMPGEDLAGRLDPEDLALLHERLADGWTLLERHHPVRADEVEALVTVVAPLTPPPTGGIRSASSREAVGCMALSTPADGREAALTFVHEVQHTKLCAVLDIEDLIGSGGDHGYYAPWRDDPRPSGGLLQGLYAFYGITGFWRLHRRLDSGERAETAHTEFARWRAGAEEVAGTLLETGDLNRAGTAFVTAILRTLEEWGNDRVPASAIAAAERLADDHRHAWKIRNGGQGQ